MSWPSIDDYNDLNSYSQYEDALAKGYSEAEAMDFVHRFSRDNARTPMQWNGETNAGFTDGTPWLPIHDSYQTENSSAEKADPGSVLNWYHQLTAFRKENRVLIDGDYREIDCDSRQVYAFLRENREQKLLVAVNFTGETVPFDLSEAGISDPGGAAVLLSSYADIRQESAQAGVLRPYEAVVIDAAT